MTDVLIFGLSDYSRLVARLFLGSSVHRLIGFTADDPALEVFCDFPVIPFASLKQSVSKDAVVFSTVGYRKMRDRAAVFERIKALGFSSTNLVCEGALPGREITLGQNNILMPGSVVEAGCELGDNNTVWSNVTVCHDTRLGNHNFLAAGTVIGGRSIVGSACFFGFSSVVLQETEVADETLLGPLSMLDKPSKSAGQYLGVPARLVASHEAQGIEID